MASPLVIAFSLSVVGNIINAWGMIAMKIGHERANAQRMHESLVRFMELQACPGSPGSREAAADTKNLDSTDLSSAFLKQCVWWIGMLVYTVGSLMHVASLGYGPSALLNPMEGLTLVANTLTAPFALGEKLTIHDIVGTVVFLIGTAIVVTFGPHTTEEYTASGIMKRSVSAMFVQTVVALFVYTMIHCLSLHDVLLHQQVLGSDISGLHRSTNLCLDSLLGLHRLSEQNQSAGWCANGWVSQATRRHGNCAHLYQHQRGVWGLHNAMREDGVFSACDGWPDG